MLMASGSANVHTGTGGDAGDAGGAVIGHVESRLGGGPGLNLSSHTADVGEVAGYLGGGSARKTGNQDQQRGGWRAPAPGGPKTILALSSERCNPVGGGSCAESWRSWDSAVL